MAAGDTAADNARRIQLWLFLVELSVAIAMAASAYVTLKVLPFTTSWTSGMFSTLAGLWIVKSTAWALQSLRKRSVREGRSVNDESWGEAENDGLKAYDLMQQRSRRVQFAEEEDRDGADAPTPSQKITDAKKFLADLADENQYTSKISFPLLAILITVLLQCAIRLLVIVQNVRRSFSWKRCSAKGSGLRFSDIPFTIGRNMSSSGCSFHIFSFLNGWLECNAGGETDPNTNVGSKMALEAVSFDRISINSSHFIVNPPRKHPAARGQLSWLGISFEDIDLCLTILLKRKGRRLDRTSVVDCTRSITIRLAIKHVEFGAFPSRLDWCKGAGICVDVNASLDDSGTKDSVEQHGLAGMGMSVALGHLNMHHYIRLASTKGEEANLQSKLVSWGVMESSLHLHRHSAPANDKKRHSRRNMASWTTIPSGFVVIDEFREGDALSKQATTNLGDFRNETRLAVGVNLRDVHAFVETGETILRDLSSCMVTSPSSKTGTSKSDSKAKKKAPMEVVEVNGALSMHFCAQDDLGYLSLGAPISFLQWKKNARSGADQSIDDAKRLQQDTSLDQQLLFDMPEATIRYEALSSDDMVENGTVTLDLVCLKRIKANLSASKCASIDLGEAILRVDAEDVIKCAGIAKAAEGTKLAAAKLQRSAKETTQPHCSAGSQQEAITNSPAARSDRKKDSLRQIEVSIGSVDLLMELPGEDNASDKVRIALLQGATAVTIAKNEGNAQDGPDSIDCARSDVPLPNTLFASEVQRCGLHYLVEAVVAHGEGSVTFFPHSSLPVLDEGPQQSSRQTQEASLYAKVSKLAFKSAVPLDKSRPILLSKAMHASFKELIVYERVVKGLEPDLSLLSIPVHGHSFCHAISDADADHCHQGWPMAQTYAQSAAADLVQIVQCKGQFCLTETWNGTTRERIESISVRFSKGSTDVEVVWSPILQWIQVSLNDRIQRALANVKVRASDQLPKKRKVLSYEMKVRIEVDSNVTANVLAFIGVQSLVHTILKGGSTMTVSIAKYLPPASATLKQVTKPNISFQSKHICVLLNGITSPIFTFEGLSVHNYFRRADESEIDEYTSKKKHAMDDYAAEIVTDQHGHPLKEIFELNLGTNASAKFPPVLLFGEVIDDFQLLPKSLDVGLDRLKGLSEGRKKPAKKYQMMSIQCTIPFLDMSLMGHDPDVAQMTAFAKRSVYRDEVRLVFEGAKVSTERNAPPERTQSEINALDEDDSSTHVYGPAIQGGQIALAIKSFMCTLHPLNLATPLVRIDDFAVNGYLYMAGLSPDTPGIQEGRKISSKLLCHHNHYSGCNSRRCCCCYGVSLHSAGIPAKLYADCRVKCRELDVSYGPVMNDSIPRLQECIQRLLPPPPKTPGQVASEPLTWWDNVCFFIHGSISLSSDQLSVRWLLDSHIARDLSVLFICKNFVVAHTVGSFGISANDIQVSIPGNAYDMSVHPSERDMKPMFHLPHEAESVVGKERHSLIYVPTIKTETKFRWKMLEPGRPSSGHHSVYMTYSAGESASLDKFASFRSDGIDVEFDFELLGSDACDTWVALRLDVLPWFTHLNSAMNYAPPLDETKSDPLPKFRSVTIRASIKNLRVAAWFEDDEDLDGLCLIVERLDYNSTVDGKKDIVIGGPVKAALLDVSEVKHPDRGQSQESNGLIDIEKMASDFGAAQVWDRPEAGDNSAQSEPHPQEEIEPLPFWQLQQLSSNIDDLDYIVVTDQIDICNQSLAKILADEGKRNTRFFERRESNMPAGVDRTTWSILVSRLRLLWTIDIRDSVMAISKDLIYVIGFMKSQSRQLQLLSGTLPEQDQNGRETYDISSPPHCGKVSTRDPSKGDSALHRSMLDYLLDESLDLDLESAPKHSSAGDVSEPSTSEPAPTKTLPTLDVHLSNPQAQLRGRSGDGALVFAAESAHVEGRKFIHFLVSNEGSKSGKISPSDLLRKTEHTYSLTNMAAYSLSTQVDVNLGIPWLEVGWPGHSPAQHAVALEKRFGISESAYDNAYFNESKVEENFSEHMGDEHDTRSPTQQYVFPAHLRHHEPIAFSKSGLLRPILDQFTFQSTQLFHRPPIHYSKEELRDFMEQGLVVCQDEAPVDAIELQIDLLDFNLDSYQFKTTLDVIRNVLLEPPKPHSRHQQLDQDDAARTAPKSSEPTETVAAIEMEQVLRDSQLRGKKRRYMLHRAAMTLLRDLEDKRLTLDGNEVFRRVSYTLSKLQWCVQNQDQIDDVQIAFTGFTGQHDYRRDGSGVSQISLEDVHVSSLCPGPDSMSFADATCVMKSWLGNERSPCTNCGQYFDHSDNHLNSCTFHDGPFKSGRWTCCDSTLPDAPGCKSGPHTGKEHAAVVRVETLPRVVEGLSLYSHVELNVFPGVLHKLVVQVSKSMSRLFMSYFFVGLGDDDEDDLEAVSASSDATGLTEAMSTHSDSPIPSVRRKSLLIGGKGSPTQGKRSNQEDFRGYADFDNPSELNPTKEEHKEAEVAFIKVWRMGDVDVNVSLGGFKRMPVSSLSLSVPAYSRAYEVGTWEHLGRKYVTHLVREVLKSGASSGLDKFRRKMTGSAATPSPGPATNQMEPEVLERSGSPRSYSAPPMPSDSGPVDVESFIGKHLRRPVGAADILGTPAKKKAPKKKKKSLFKSR